MKQFGRSRRSGGTPDLPTQLDGLLEDMRDLRLTLVADLNAAAGAAESGADDLAEEILEADRRELARFARIADARLLRLQRLAEAPEQPEPRPAWRRRIAVIAPVAPVVGVMAVAAAAATGVLPVPGHGNGTPASPRSAAVAPVDNLPGSSSFRQFANVIGSDPSAKQVIAAASKLHRQLARLIASSPNDPQRADQVAELLRMEQSLLMQAQPPGARVVLDATRRLAARLVTVTPRTIQPTTIPGNLLTTAPKPHKSTSPTASPKPKTTSPKPKTSSPKPSPTSSSSSSPSQPDGFPALPG